MWSCGESVHLFKCSASIGQSAHLKVHFVNWFYVHCPLISLLEWPLPFYLGPLSLLEFILMVQFSGLTLK